MDTSLFNDFENLSYDWKQVVARELKQPNAADELTWQAEEGISFSAYHETVKVEAQSTAAALNEVLSKQSVREEFYNTVKIDATEAKQANKAALAALNGGANGLSFRKVKAKDISTLLQDVLSEFIYLEMHFEQAQAGLTELKNHLGWDKAQKQLGLINYSPLSHLLAKGNWNTDQKADFEALAAHINYLQKEFPLAKGIRIDAALAADAGANLSQQIAYALSQGNEYMKQLTALGLSADEVATQLQFHFGTGQQYLLECVKLNAFRVLWAKILENYGASTSDCFISTGTCPIGTAIYDSHNNLLRYTTASMSAIIAGSDSHTVTPFDANYKNDNDFSARLARNITTILLDESFLKTSKQATLGSFFFENALHELAKNAWGIFQKWEKTGGFISAALQGTIQAAIVEVAATKQARFDANELIVLGVNRYPNKTENKKSAIEKAAHHKENQEKLVKTLVPIRLAEASEFDRLAQE